MGIATTHSSKAIILANDEHPDLFILDLMIPPPDGFTLCSMLRADPAFVRTPILIITAKADSNSKATSFGANDYLAKPFHLNELLARIQSLVRRSQMQQNMHETQILRYEDLELNLITLQVTRSMNKIVLTPKEFSLLEYFVKNKERVIPKVELLEKIWGLGDENNTWRARVL